MSPALWVLQKRPVVRAMQYMAVPMPNERALRSNLMPARSVPRGSSSELPLHAATIARSPGCCPDLQAKPGKLSPEPM